MDRELQQALELVVQPAFFAENGKIVWRNAAAAALLTVGMEISALLDRELLTLWNREDVLRFPAALGGTEYLVSVRTMPQGELFVAERRAVGELADRLTAASAKLRRPLHNMVSSAQTMFETLSEDAGTRDARAELNRALYQLLRLCGQLSDGGRALQHELTACRRSVDAGAFFDALAEELETLLRAAGRRFRYDGLQGPCRIWMDSPLVERAVYNLAANSLEHTRPGGTICLSVQRMQRALAVRVTDDGDGLKELYDSPEGLQGGGGLGLVLVREIARLHGGAMMLSGNGAQPGATAVFSLSLRPASAGLHSPMPQYDYTSGYHHGLVELSCLLPPESYNPEEVL